MIQLSVEDRRDALVSRHTSRDHILFDVVSPGPLVYFRGIKFATSRNFCKCFKIIMEDGTLMRTLPSSYLLRPPSA
jgi:hypothetical protein